MMKIIFVLGTFLFLPDLASACSCSPPPPIVEAWQQADTVFEGTVTAVPSGGTEAVAFKVHRTWKGDAKDSVTVKSNPHVNMCAYDFRPNRKYLVYAMKEGGAEGWTTSICSRTKPSRKAKAEIAKLDRLKK